MVEVLDHSQTSYSIKEGTVHIAAYAFSGCDAMESISIPASVKYLGEEAYRNYFNTYGTTPKCLKSIYISDLAAWLNINTNKFSCPIGQLYVNGSLLTEAYIPEGVENIRDLSFYGCNSLTKVVIPNTTTSIGSYAFAGCSSLISINIPNSVTFIKDGVFSGCENLSAITIPSSIELIDEGAFYGVMLRNIKCKASSAPRMNSYSYSLNQFSEPTYAHANLYVPEGSWDSYAFHPAWYHFNNIKEYVEEKGRVSKVHAYTLMDEDYNYAVYDEVNANVRMVPCHQIEEQNVNTSWTLQEINSKKYLYNLGAKKFATRSADGTGFTLSESPIAIDAKDVADGITFNSGNSKWNFVTNNNLYAINIEDVVNDITTAVQSASLVSEIYSADGRSIPAMRKGINILRHADGTVTKVIQ